MATAELEEDGVLQAEALLSAFVTRLRSFVQELQRERVCELRLQLRRFVAKDRLIDQAESTTRVEQPVPMHHMRREAMYGLRGVRVGEASHPGRSLPNRF